MPPTTRTRRRQRTQSQQESDKEVEEAAVLTNKKRKVVSKDNDKDDDTKHNDSEDSDSVSDSNSDSAAAAAAVAAADAADDRANAHLLKSKYSRYRRDYFAQQSSTTTTSGATLSELDMLTEKQQRALYESLAITNAARKQGLLAHYETQFRHWFLQLRNDFNILLYGIGSKKELVHKFAKEWLTDGPVVVVNGYFPGVSLKHVLTKIIHDVLQYSDTSMSWRDTNQQLEFISRVLRSPASFVKHLYVVVHNIDGRMLRKNDVQHTLSELASIPAVHMIATVDHVLSPLMWDFQCLSRYRWSWQDCTTYRPYIKETCYDTPVMGGNADVRTRGIQYVLMSLTPNHRDILNLLAQQQQQQEDEKSLGLDFQEFLALCQENMLTSSDTGLRTHLTELLDHDLVQLKRHDGRELYFIPNIKEVLAAIEKQQ
jgi:origin recognition complex subunit 2